MTAAGKVITGYSKPYVALYSATDNVVSYSAAQKLARGVSVSASPESSDSNNFYADNIIAESLAGQFTGGQVTLTVDGLLQDSEKLIQGLPTADADGFIHYNDDQQKPYCGIGFIVRYMSDNVTYYTPRIFTKGTFNQLETAAETQGKEVEFQTQELVFNIMKDDSIKHDWMLVGADYSSEAEAEEALKNFFGLSIPVTGVTIAPKTAAIAVGATEALTPTIAPSNASNQNVTFESSDTAVATVSVAGIVTGVSAGTATITVTTVDGGFTDTCEVTVS